MILLALFIVIPVIEIALFIQVGGVIGLWPTVAIVLGMALLGARLVRAQGLKVLADLRGSLEQMRDPSAPLAHGAMILLAGALMLTPGFFTDLCGILLLLPPVRRWAIAQLGKRVRMQAFQMGPRPQEDIIDGEFSEQTPPRPPLR